MVQDLRVAVVIASAGRPELVVEVLETLAEQEGVTFDTVVSVPDASSLPARPDLLDRVIVITGTRGAAAQRNAGIAMVADAQVVAFFDDDSVLRPDWLAEATAFFERHPRAVGLTGRVLLDGAVSGEITMARTHQAIEDSTKTSKTGSWRPWEELYGCNFAVRLDLIGDERFDERLPLYSWLEDHDLARRLLRIGEIARVDDCVMVHRAAATGGRQAHVKLGYSQVMNPFYLYRKGSFSLLMALSHLGKRVAKNSATSVAGPQKSWRRERLRGNGLALADVARNRVTPERILDLP